MKPQLACDWLNCETVPNQKESDYYIWSTGGVLFREFTYFPHVILCFLSCFSKLGAL